MMSNIPAFGQSSATASPGVFGIVENKPALSIGVRDGDEPYQLFRVYGALRFPDGSIAISNSGSQSIRVFDGKGVFLKNVGREGAGPAEFGREASTRMYRMGDSVIALDEWARRFHVFDSRLKFLQTRHLRTLEGFPFPFIIGAFSDGTLLTEAYVNGGAARAEPGAVIKQPYVLARYSAVGNQLNTVASVEGRPRYQLRFANSKSQPFVPLSAEPLHAIIDNEVFLLRGAKTEIEVFNSAGKVVRTIKWNAPTVKASKVWGEYQKDDLAKMVGQQRAKYEYFFSLKLPLPELAPTYSAMIVDSEKRLWLRRYTIGRTEATWDVLNRTGDWLGTVRTPARFTLYGVDKEFLLGRRLDDLDVESVQLLRWRSARK